MSRGNINTVSGNVTYTPSSYLNTFVINIRTHMASGNIDTVPLKINLYAQWLSEYNCNQNIYTYTQWLYQYNPWKYKPTCPMAISILTPSGYLNRYTQWQY